ncbi:stress responsive a b barrel [Fusarium heterosporum]|uniref:Stress responsive a b barrel n=1 Tax=Fusarium heterosporum TaxID=42747 RepID=A0A8H5TPP0_FUSHE|nr:stress responsive a b barrel [Fusarium heterosporum]
MNITHTVLFQFKADVSQNDIKDVCDHFLDLKDQCVNSESKDPYILSLRGGKDKSIEGKQDGITHGFVVEFNSAKDRDYYVNEDPAHQAFVEKVGGLVEKAIVVDFENGSH